LKTYYNSCPGVVGNNLHIEAMTEFQIMVNTANYNMLLGRAWLGSPFHYPTKDQIVVKE